VEQGTVKDYDEGTRKGSLLMDDRTEIAIDERSLTDAGVITLRIGQRVKFETEDRTEGRVARFLRLVTFD
jgi:cold shock CspA family protein